MTKGMKWAFAAALLTLAGLATREFTAKQGAHSAPAPAAVEASSGAQAPSLAGPAADVDVAKRSEHAALPTPAATPAAPRERNYASLNRRFPGGLQTEALQALRASNGVRAFEVASEMAACTSWARLREEYDKRGKQEVLAAKYPELKSAEQARLDAFCQTAGPDMQNLENRLVLLAAQQEMRDAVYWAHDMELDPSGASSRLIGRWAMDGKDLLALRKVVYSRQPDIFGLHMDDQNVARKAAVLLAQTPEYANESGIERMIQLGQDTANYQRAGVSSSQAYEALPNKPPPVKFAEIALSPADEQRARDIVRALVEARHRRLTEAGR